MITRAGAATSPGSARKRIAQEASTARPVTDARLRRARRTARRPTSEVGSEAFTGTTWRCPGARARGAQQLSAPERLGQRLHILRRGLSQHFFLKSDLCPLFFFFLPIALIRQAARPPRRNYTRLRLDLKKWSRRSGSRGGFHGHARLMGATRRGPWPRTLRWRGARQRSGGRRLAVPAADVARGEARGVALGEVPAAMGDHPRHHRVVAGPGDQQVTRTDRPELGLLVGGRPVRGAEAPEPLDALQALPLEALGLPDQVPLVVVELVDPVLGLHAGPGALGVAEGELE